MMNWLKGIFFSILFFTSIVAISDDVHAIQTTKFYEYSNAKGVTVINYHSFGEHKEIDNINISKKMFREQLMMLRENGYSVISEPQLIAYLQGHGRIPEKSVFLTIDDGFESVYTIAYPILKELGMQATLFVIVKDMEKGSRKGVPMLNWQQLKEMMDSNIIHVGNHTYDLHWRGNNDAPNYEAMILNQTKEGQPLTNEARQQLIVEDVTKSSKLIEQYTGKKTTSFAYPYGAYDRFAERAIKQAGYLIDYSTTGGFNIFGSGTVHIKRIDSSNRMSVEKLKKTLDKHQMLAEQQYKNRDIQVEASISPTKVQLKAWLRSDMNGGALQAKETRFELYKVVEGERQLQRNFGSYRVEASESLRVMTNGENIANYGVGSYSIKTIIVKQDGTKEVYWVNFSR